MHAVTRLVGTCEPSDIIANRLDPWHGSWYHPYSFAHLDVLSAPPADADLPEEQDRFLVPVTFHVGRFGVPVVAEFSAPEPRTIVMRIVDGEGAGSVVETHATPVGPGPDGLPRSAVIEAVIAHSDRPGFAHALHGRPLIAPFMRYAAATAVARRSGLRRAALPGAHPRLDSSGVGLRRLGCRVVRVRRVFRWGRVRLG